MKPPQLSIVLICGSIAEKSHTRALLAYIADQLSKQEVTATLWDLREKPMPIALPQYHHDPMKNPNELVREFASVIQNSDGIVLGTPLYHGSYSGVLKNALDNLDGDALRQKAVGLACNGSGPRAGSTPLDHLRSVVRTLYGYTLQSQLSTHKADYSETENGYLLTDTDIQERCKRFSDELIAFSTLLKNSKNA